MGFYAGQGQNKSSGTIYREARKGEAQGGPNNLTTQLCDRFRVESERKVSYWLRCLRRR